MLLIALKASKNTTQKIITKLLFRGLILKITQSLGLWRRKRKNWENIRFS